MNKKITATKFGFLYCFAHFSVETACFYYLYNNLNIGNTWWIIALLYDALAFLPQNIMGIIADKFPKICYGAIGFIMVLASLIFPFSWFGLVSIALGNALIHIDGAEKTLINSNGKIAPNAIFVGGGSFGVILGRLLGVNSKLFVLIPIFLVLISIVLLLIFTSTKFFAPELKNNEVQIDSTPSVVSEKISQRLLTLIIIFVVAVRGYLAYSIPTGWSVNTFHLIILYSYMGLGKMFGGIVVDKLGYKPATIISILGALPFLLLGNNLPLISLTGVFLYSMSMPITIGMAYSKFKNSPGFAFGITTIGLFIGFCPEFFFSVNTLIAQQIVVSVLSIIVFILIFISLNKEVKNV